MTAKFFLKSQKDNLRSKFWLFYDPLGSANAKFYIAQAIKYNTEQEWEYVMKLKSNIWNYKGLIIGYGIKFYPHLEWFKSFPNLINLIA